MREVKSSALAPHVYPVKRSWYPTNILCVKLVLMALLPLPPSSSLLALPPSCWHAPRSPLPRLPDLQLNLIHSEVSNLAGFDVEGVINPTNAELELKDDLGEIPSPAPTLPSLSGSSGVSMLKILELRITLIDLIIFSEFKMIRQGFVYCRKPGCWVLRLTVRIQDQHSEIYKCTHLVPPGSFCSRNHFMVLMHNNSESHQNPAINVWWRCKSH